MPQVRPLATRPRKNRAALTKLSQSTRLLRVKYYGFIMRAKAWFKPMHRCLRSANRGRSCEGGRLVGGRGTHRLQNLGVGPPLGWRGTTAWNRACGRTHRIYQDLGLGGGGTARTGHFRRDLTTPALATSGLRLSCRGQFLSSGRQRTYCKFPTAPCSAKRKLWQFLLRKQAELMRARWKWRNKAH